MVEGCVCVVVVPGDVALRPATDRPQIPFAGFAPALPVVRPPDESLDAPVAFLNESKRITLLYGGGCTVAKAELLELGRLLQAPMVHALGGKNAVEADDPYDVGMTGLIGFSSGYHALRKGDALLMLGTDFPYPQRCPDHTHVARISEKRDRCFRHRDRRFRERDRSFR